MAPSSPPQREKWWNDLSIVGLGKELVEGATVSVPAGEAALADAVTAVDILVAGGYAAPAPARPDSSTTSGSTRRLNLALVEENRIGRDHGCLVATAIGSALEVEPIEMLALDLLWGGHSEDAKKLATRMSGILLDQGRTIREQGQGSV